MRARFKIFFVVVVVLLLAVFFVTTKGIAPPTPNPPGTFSFAALGDAPYYLWEDMQYALVLDELDAHDLSFVLQVGDVFWRPCIDRLYLRSLDWFNGLRHPVIYTPGDNEWTDCWEPGSGGFPPLDRLKRLREIYFVEPNRSLGGTRIPLQTQASNPRFAEFPENVRWSHRGIILATVHVVGSSNARDPYPDRTEADIAESRRRTEAAAAWVRETFAEARATGATAVVIAFHANPSFEEAVDSVDRRPFEPFLAALEEEVEAFGKPVLSVHGDDHDYLVDRPLTRRTTGRRLENFTRLQVPGSPDVGWVRVVVTPGDETRFAFEEYVVPGWKYW